MGSLTSEDVTRYLRAIEQGDDDAVGELLPHVYDDLRGLAQQVFRGQRPEHTLQPTALVHEAYLRLAKPDASGFNDRRHFMRVAAMAMRQLLKDHARSRNAEKRAGSRERVLLEQAEGEADQTGPEVDLAALDEALTELRNLDERQAQIVELRFLTGLTVEETADVLGVSERTVYLDWKMARAWLERRLADVG